MCRRRASWGCTKASPARCSAPWPRPADNWRLRRGSMHGEPAVALHRLAPAVVWICLALLRAQNAVLFWSYGIFKSMLTEVCWESAAFLRPTETQLRWARPFAPCARSVLCGVAPQRPGEDLSLLKLAIAGAGAGAVVPCVLTPVELIKCRLQVLPWQGLTPHCRPQQCAWLAGPAFEHLVPPCGPLDAGAAKHQHGVSIVQRPNRLRHQDGCTGQPSGGCRPLCQKPPAQRGSNAGRPARSWRLVAVVPARCRSCGIQRRVLF